jgi:hypothetical protein
MASEPIETADSKPRAQELQVEWAARLTSMGMEKTHGVAVRFIRLSGRAACWGVFIEPHAVATPPACPCGEIHEFSADTRVAYENIAMGLPETVVISAGGRAWLVPRIFIAAHGLKADDLPAIAARYGFAEGGV